MLRRALGRGRLGVRCRAEAGGRRLPREERAGGERRGATCAAGKEAPVLPPGCETS